MSKSRDGFVARRDGVIDWLDASSSGALRTMTAAIAPCWSCSAGPACCARLLTVHPVALGDGLPLLHGLNNVADAITRAKAAGEKDVLVHGAKVAQLALAAGLLDELEVHQVPVLLGDGRRLFDGLGPEHIELELAP
jgi:hypothetical protein